MKTRTRRPLTESPDRFTLDPLTAAERAALTAATLIAANRVKKLTALTADTIEWTPVPAPITRPTHFTVSAPATPSPALLDMWPETRAVFLVAAFIPARVTGGPDYFGAATTRAHARQLAEIYMATQPPARRHGFMLSPAGAILPLSWESATARRGFMRSLTA